MKNWHVFKNGCDMTMKKGKKEIKKKEAFLNVIPKINRSVQNVTSILFKWLPLLHILQQRSLKFYTSETILFFLGKHVKFGNFSSFAFISNLF